MTKREKFVAIVNVLEGIEGMNPELIEAVKHEIELLDNRKTGERKPTKTQVENEAFKAIILTVLGGADAPMTVRQIQETDENLGKLTNQRITHMITALRKAKQVKRTMVKKVPHYELGAEETEG